jgi:quinol monooxygenase YgiN
MAVMRIVESPEATPADYDRANEILNIHTDGDAPEGLIQHVCARDGNGLVIVDVWESEEALDRFFQERLGPALQESGVAASAGPPRTFQVHNRLTGKGAQASVLVLLEIDDLSSDDYDAMAASMEAFAGEGNHPVTTHVAVHKDGGGMVIADLWESPEAFGKFAQEEIAPASERVGLGPIEPRIVPVHNRLEWGQVGSDSACLSGIKCSSSRSFSLKLMPQLMPRAKAGV